MILYNCQLVNSALLKLISGPSMLIYWVTASEPGSYHDSYVLRTSGIFDLFEAGFEPFPGAVVLADSAYEAFR